jgi:hypothetical protein
MTELKLLKSDTREIDQAEIAQPKHIVAWEIYMLQQSIARVMELGRLYPEIMAVNMLLLSECFSAFAKLYADLSRRM